MDAGAVSLTALTSLRLWGAYLGEADGVQPETIEALPPSLRRLEAELYCVGAMDMSGLRLTELILHPGTLDEGDELPPTLVRLECDALCSRRPLRRRARGRARLPHVRRAQGQAHCQGCDG